MAYHHGDLRATLIDAAVDAIEADGVDRLSLRDLARRVGVSHAAPMHHFGDRTGLFTAIAADGFDRLARALEASRADFIEAGVAYVRFAVADPGRFAVMFRPELLRDDPALVAARDRAGALLREGAGLAGGDTRADVLAAWSLVHGFATLWNAGAIDSTSGARPDDLARAVAARLFGDVAR